LREFIYFRASQPPSCPGHASIAKDGDAWAGTIGIDDHAAEFEELEMFAAATNASRSIQNWPWRIQFHPYRYG